MIRYVRNVKICYSKVQAVSI